MTTVIDYLDIDANKTNQILNVSGRVFYLISTSYPINLTFLNDTNSIIAKCQDVATGFKIRFNGDIPAKVRIDTQHTQSIKFADSSDDVDFNSAFNGDTRKRTARANVQTIILSDSWERLDLPAEVQQNLLRLVIAADPDPVLTVGGVYLYPASDVNLIPADMDKTAEFLRAGDIYDERDILTPLCIRASVANLSVYVTAYYE